ncbi:MAG: class I adenylate-forming enzyme family protein [Solirubrobacteraceae bacterium]
MWNNDKNRGRVQGAVDVPYLVRRAARDHAHVPAVDDGSRVWRMAELVARAERFANALDALGVEPGACVGVLSENRTAYVEADLGIALARRVRVAMNPRLALPDFRYAVQDADVRVLIHSGRFAAEAAALHDELGVMPITFDPSPDSSGRGFDALVEEARPDVIRRGGGDEAPAWISYTSGTTGRPKGIVLSHRAIREVALNLALELGPHEPGEQIVLTQPLSHGAGYFVLPYLMSGAGMCILERFDPERVFELSTRPDVRTLKLVPTMLSMLLEHDRGAPFGYDSVIYGAAPIPGPVLDASLERFGPVLVQIYGQSEAPVTLTCLHKRDHEGDGARRSSAGRAWRSVGVEVCGEDGEPLPRGERGEVMVTGQHLMTGYHNRPEETAEVLTGGWVRTRDMGMMDESGYLYLLGRTDEMINSGGFNIAPREVEQALTEHPSIEEVCVMGLPDDRWGTVVSAALRARRGAALEVADVLQFAKPRLGFRAPKRVVILDEIPKNAYGKVDRAGLRARLEEDGR